MSQELTMSNVTDNSAQSQFQLTEDGDTAIANYRRNGDTLYIDFVESPPALRGKGTAGRLMAGLMAIAQRQHLKVVPICGYAAAWIRRHPDSAESAS